MAPASGEIPILVSAAERSGDLHAANLVREVKGRGAAVRFEGFGGELLRQAGCRLHEDLVSLASMGFGFRRHIFRYYRILRKFQRILDEMRPRAVVLVDSPGLHFAFARLARWKRVPVVYYICPQIWAWGPWRRAKVLRYTNLLLVILPFEEELYRNPRVPVRYVGHPLADSLQHVRADAGARLRERVGLGSGVRVISILPGSREHEVRGLMPIFARVLAELRASGRDAHALVSCFREDYRGVIEGALRQAGVPHDVLGEDSRSIAQAGDLVLVASGTASLEAAYFEKPMLVLYRAGAMARFFFKLMSVTPYFSLPNILGVHLFGGEPVVPERLCRGGEAAELARLAGSLLDSGPVRESAVARLRTLKEHVFHPGATGRAAEALLEFVRDGRPKEPPGDPTSRRSP